MIDYDEVGDLKDQIERLRAEKITDQEMANSIIKEHSQLIEKLEGRVERVRGYNDGLRERVKELEEK
jgi:predicted nuclease with TOPRIM domain